MSIYGDNTRLQTRVRILSQIFAKDVFCISSLYPAQLNVLEILTMMQFKLSTPLLFVRPTGGGKSLVRDVYSVLFRGVSLTIVPVLSLGSDLAVNVWDKSSHSTCGCVISIHLEEITNESDVSSIIRSTLALPNDKKDSYVVCLASVHSGKTPLEEIRLVAVRKEATQTCCYRRDTAIRPLWLVF